MKKSYFLQEARLYSQLERSRCSITSRGEFLFFILGRKERYFVISSTGCRDVMSLKERSNLPPLCFSHIAITGQLETEVSKSKK